MNALNPKGPLHGSRDLGLIGRCLVSHRSVKPFFRHPYKAMGIRNHLGRFWTLVVAIEHLGYGLAFIRRERRRLFPGAADNERREEIKEGLPSYTQVAAWANSPADAHRVAAESSQK